MQSNKKITIDVLMILGMFFSMSFHLYGAGVHKMIGLLTFILFVVHSYINRKWYGVLGKGQYTPLRLAHTVTNLLVVAAMFGLILSGVMLSRELAAGAADDSMTMGRLLHLVSSYTGCGGIALHIGFHLKRRTQYD